MKSFNLHYVLLLILLFCGCKKKEKEIIGCTHQFTPEVLNFKIVSKDTNTDLFFSPQPLYNTAQLKVFQNDKIVPFEVKTDGTNGNYFRVEVKVAYNNTTEKLQIKIADLPSQELSYTTTITSDPCPRYPVNNMTFNSINYTNVKQHVITLKL